METQLTVVQYAGMTIGVRCADERMAKAIEKTYPDFVGEPASILTHQVHVSVLGKHRQEPASDPHVIRRETSLIFDSPGFEGDLNLETGNATLAFSSRNPFFELDLFLRILGSLWAIRLGGLQLHCAAVDRQSRGYIFFGHSGSGKTTTARLSTDKKVLSDDLNILLPGKQEWWVHATPFWNPTQARPKPASACLAGIYRLVKSAHHLRKEMDPIQAMAELISCVPVLRVVPDIFSELTNNLQTLVNSIPCYWLEFRKDAGFWKVVD